MEQPGYQVVLDVFEGPLDLLLHLVKKHELSILDIPISFVTEKYLEYLDAMAGLDIDVAGEYLLMAATLCHIKSRELLPDPSRSRRSAGEGGGEAAEAEVDPRADLIRRLLEYQKYKEAADQLGERPVVGRNVWSRGAPTEDAVAEGIDADAIAPLAPFPVHKLIEAFDRVMKQAKVKVAHNVLVDRLSVSQRISELTDRLEREGAVHLHLDVQLPARRRGAHARRGQARGRRDVPRPARDGQAPPDLRCRKRPRRMRRS